MMREAAEPKGIASEAVTSLPFVRVKVKSDV